MGRPMKPRSMLALTTAMSLTLTAPAFAQADVAVQESSLGHSALKATTFKVGSTIVNLVLLSRAADGIVGGAALTAFMTVSSWAIYTANDYLWDSYSFPDLQAGCGFGQTDITVRLYRIADDNRCFWRRCHRYQQCGLLCQQHDLGLLFLEFDTLTSDHHGATLGTVPSRKGTSKTILFQTSP